MVPLQEALINVVVSLAGDSTALGPVVADPYVFLSSEVLRATLDYSAAEDTFANQTANLLHVILLNAL